MDSVWNSAYASLWVWISVLPVGWLFYIIEPDVNSMCASLHMVLNWYLAVVVSGGVMCILKRFIVPRGSLVSSPREFRWEEVAPPHKGMTQCLAWARVIIMYHMKCLRNDHQILGTIWMDYYLTLEETQSEREIDLQETHWMCCIQVVVCNMTTAKLQSHSNMIRMPLSMEM